MGGAGSLIAANYVYNVAAQDGTSLLVPLSIYLNQLTEEKEVKFDVRRFNWIGSQSQRTKRPLHARGFSVQNSGSTDQERRSS